MCYNIIIKNIEVKKMKKSVYLLSILFLLFGGVIGCNLGTEVDEINNTETTSEESSDTTDDTSPETPENNPPENNPPEETPPSEPENNTPEDPGNVDNVILSFNLPENVNSIQIYRKKSNETEWQIYISARFFTAEIPTTLEISDPFVNPGETYNYKYNLIISNNPSTYNLTENDATLIKNGNTRNFTPAFGYGEIEFSETPEYSLDEYKTTLTLTNKLEVTPADIPNYYSNAIYYLSDSKNWESWTIDFEENLKINLQQLFSPEYGKKILKGLGPSYIQYYLINNNNIINCNVWYFGKLYDFSNENIEIDYNIEPIVLRNTPNGIDIQLTKKCHDSSWQPDSNGEINISIYEDNNFICKYYIKPNYFQNPSTYFETMIQSRFIYPFTTIGKTYKFIFSIDGETPIEKSITATNYTPAQIDITKLNNIKQNIDYSYTERTITASTDLLDILDDNYQDLSAVKFQKIELVFLNENGEKIGSSEINNDEYQSFISSNGFNILNHLLILDVIDYANYLDVLKTVNNNGNFKIKPIFKFLFENDINSGYFYIEYPQSEVFQW